MNKTKRKKGFTLLEILLVVAALGILAGIVIVAINPSKQMGDTRDAQRKVDVNTIINAIYQYAIDTGSLPSTITTTATPICNTTGSPACDTFIDFGVLMPTYVSGIPEDPTCATTNSTCYTVVKSSGTTPRVTVSATGERAGTISVTR